MQLFSSTGSQPDLSQAVLLLPAVTAGNVGELCVDVCISSLLGPSGGTSQPGITHVGWLESDYVLPVVGCDAYSMDRPGTLSTALDLFHINGSKVFVLQQRAPARQGCQQLFAQEVVSWVKASGVAQSLVLCGLEGATLRRDEQMEGPQLRYSSVGGASDAVCRSLGWASLEEELLQEEKQIHSLIPPWPFMAAAQEKGHQALLLTLFVSEGANQPDGIELAKHLIQYLAVSGLLQGSPALELLGLAQGEEGLSLMLRLPCSWAALDMPGRREA